MGRVLYISLALLSSPLVDLLVFVGCSLGFILFLYPEFFLFLHLLPRFAPLSLCSWVSFPPPFCVFLFFPPSWILCCFSLSCPLPFFSLPPWGSLRCPSFVGFLPSGSLPLVSESLCAWSLRVFLSSGLRSGHFLSALLLLLSCASSPCCLFRPWNFPLLSHSWFVSSRSSFLSFSPLGVSSPFIGGFLTFLVPSLLRVGIFSSCLCRSFMPPLRLPHFCSLSPFAFVPSIVGGSLPGMFIFVHIPALRVSLSCNFHISFRSHPLFQCPRFPIRSLSRTSFFSFPSGS